MYACHFQCLALSLANDIFTGICYLLNGDDKSFSIIGRRGIKILSLLPISVITVAFMTFGP
ncbi:Tigger transposable element-derived protein 4, partial [Araneus ventricosus]